MTEPDDAELDEFVVDVPAGHNDHPMTLRELREAVEDESNPRHAEAVQRNKELAAELQPAIERLAQTVARQSEMKDALANTREAASFATDAAIGNPAIERQFQQMRLFHQQIDETRRAADSAIEARTEQQRQEDEWTRQTLDVLMSMDARLVQLNDQIHTVDRQIESGHESSSKVSHRTLVVGVLTLVATVVGIVLSWYLSR